jgi:putative transcriptional regulator
MDMNEVTRWTIQVLERTDFIISRIQGISEMSFDLAARRDDLLLLIKIIKDRNSLRSDVASEMKVLAGVLTASPLILIPSIRGSMEQDGVLYISYGIPLMTINTLKDHLVEEVPPMVYYSSGGHFVTLDGPRMRELRDSTGISLGSLSKQIGVSRRAVQMYESGMGVDLETALKIEDALGIQLVLPLDPFSRGEELQEIRDTMSKDDSECMEVLDHLNSIGMEVIRTTRCPFDALARRDRDLLMTSIGCEDRSLKEIGSALSSLTMVTGNESFLVATGPVKGRSIGGTPLLSVRDVKKTEDIDQLLDLIRDRRRKNGKN